MKVRTSPRLNPGQVVVLADYEHPEVNLADFRWDRKRGLVGEPAPVPDGRIIYCNPADEQHVRDVLAVAQEHAP